MIGNLGIGPVSCDEIVGEVTFCLREFERASKVLCACSSYEGTENDGFEYKSHYVAEKDQCDDWNKLWIL